MKVVLFCGGLGLRIRDESERLPKPMLRIGTRPILWHIMKYYAHFGHTDFILCLGYKGDTIKEYFLDYNEAISNDFVLSGGGRQIDLINTDLDDWRITFVDTGLNSTVGERLRRVEEYVGEDEFFLANYADTLTDVNLPTMVDRLQTSGKTGIFLSVRPSYTFHVIESDGDDIVRGLHDVAKSNVWINGGYFVFRRNVFDYLEEGEDLVNGPFLRMIDREELLAYRYEGYWGPMDTLKDRQQLELLAESGVAPWRLWKAGQPPRQPVADIR
ncbi:MAG TPA: sugar phosphate nucleotidyltransferase [Gaiellaceae bacterium]